MLMASTTISAASAASVPLLEPYQATRRTDAKSPTSVKPLAPTIKSLNRFILPPQSKPFTEYRNIREKAV